MDSKIIWSPKAASNLENIFRYIANDSAYYAATFIARLLTIINTIPNFPYSGRIVPEYNESTLRELLFKHYRIIYRVKEPTCIEIVAICHSTKPLEDLL